MSDHDQRASKILSLLHERVRLEPWQRITFYLMLATVWLSGALWLGAEWLKDADLGPVRTPAQTASMQVHGAAMMLYLAMLGTLLIHVRRGFALRTNRVSGAIVMAIHFVLAVSGWMLYYVAGDLVRQWSSVLHWSLGGLLLPLLMAHIWIGRRRARILQKRISPVGAHDTGSVLERAVRSS